jgi:hypothetical protein
MSCCLFPGSGEDGFSRLEISTIKAVIDVSSHAKCPLLSKPYFKICDKFTMLKLARR